MQRSAVAQAMSQTSLAATVATPSLRPRAHARKDLAMWRQSWPHVRRPHELFHALRPRGGRNLHTGSRGGLCALSMGRPCEKLPRHDGPDIFAEVSDGEVTFTVVIY